MTNLCSRDGRQAAGHGLVTMAAGCARCRISRLAGRARRRTGQRRHRRPPIATAAMVRRAAEGIERRDTATASTAEQARPAHRQVAPRRPARHPGQAARDSHPHRDRASTPVGYALNHRVAVSHFVARRAGRHLNEKNRSMGTARRPPGVGRHAN